MSPKTIVMADPTENFPKGAPKDSIKAEFGRRITKRLALQQMTQAELARAVQKHLNLAEPPRAGMSTYCRGIAIPGPKYLNAILEVLKVSKEELIPLEGITDHDVHPSPAMDARDIGGGKAWLRINQAVPWEDAIEIMQIVKRKPAE